MDPVKKVMYPTLEPVPEERRGEVFGSRVLPGGGKVGSLSPPFLLLRAVTEKGRPVADAQFELFKPGTNLPVGLLTTDKNGFARFDPGSTSLLFLKYRSPVAERILLDTTGAYADMSTGCAFRAVFHPSAELNIMLDVPGVILDDYRLSNINGKIFLYGKHMETVAQISSSLEISVPYLFAEEYTLKVDADGFTYNQSLVPCLNWGKGHKVSIQLHEAGKFLIKSYDAKKKRFVPNINYYLVSDMLAAPVEKTCFTENGDVLFTMRHSGDFYLKARKLPKRLNPMPLEVLSPLTPRPGETVEITIYYNYIPYDAQSKLLLSHPFVLACVLQTALPALFGKMTMADVVSRLSPDWKKTRINSQRIFSFEQDDPTAIASFGQPFASPLPTEYVSMTEGESRYDLHRRILVPEPSREGKGNDELEILIVEAQKDDQHIDRDVVPRNPVYLGRSVSSQVNPALGKKAYQEVLRTNLIWIFPKPSTQYNYNRIIRLPAEGVVQAFEEDVRIIPTYTLKKNYEQIVDAVKGSIKTCVDNALEATGQGEIENNTLSRIMTPIRKALSQIIKDYYFNSDDATYVHKEVTSVLTEHLPEIVLALYSNKYKDLIRSASDESPFEAACMDALEQIRKMNFDKSYEAILIAELEKAMHQLPAKIENEISKFITDSLEGGFRTEFGHMNDYFREVCVFLGPPKSASCRAHQALDYLFSTEISRHERIRILEEDYGFPKNADFRKEVNKLGAFAEALSRDVETRVTKEVRGKDLDMFGTFCLLRDQGLGYTAAATKAGFDVKDPAVKAFLTRIQSPPPPPMP